MKKQIIAGMLLTAISAQLFCPPAAEVKPSTLEMNNPKKTNASNVAPKQAQVPIAEIAAQQAEKSRFASLTPSKKATSQPVEVSQANLQDLPDEISIENMFTTPEYPNGKYAIRNSKTYESRLSATLPMDTDSNTPTMSQKVSPDSDTTTSTNSEQAKPWSAQARAQRTPEQNAAIKASADTITVVAPDASIVSTPDASIVSKRNSITNEYIVQGQGNNSYVPKSQPQNVDSIGKSGLENITSNNLYQMGKAVYNAPGRAVSLVSGGGGKQTNIITPIGQSISDAYNSMFNKTSNSALQGRTGAQEMQKRPLNTYSSNDRSTLALTESSLKEQKLAQVTSNKASQGELVAGGNNNALVIYNSEFAKSQQGGNPSYQGYTAYKAPQETVLSKIYNAPGRAVSFVRNQFRSADNQLEAGHSTEIISPIGRSVSSAYNSLPTLPSFKSNKVAPDTTTSNTTTEQTVTDNSDQQI